MIVGAAVRCLVLAVLWGCSAAPLSRAMTTANCGVPAANGSSETTATTLVGCSDPNATCASIFTSSGGARVVSGACTELTETTEVVECICRPTPSSTGDLVVSVSRNMSTAVCTWNTTFDSFVHPSNIEEDDGISMSCNPTTGLCPTRSDCGSTTSLFALPCASRALTCGGPQAGLSASLGSLTNVSLVLQCYTCDGGSLAIYVEETTGSCVKDFTVAPTASTCRPETTCFGRGCCAPIFGAVSEATPVGSCYCFADNVRGYWAASSKCAQCDVAYDSQGTGGPCTNAKSQIVVLLQTLGETSPAVMILPNLLIMLIFVFLGMVRPVWPEDANFHLTTLRRAGLLWSRLAKRSGAAMAYDDNSDVILPILREAAFAHATVSQESTRGGSGGGARRLLGLASRHARSHSHGANVVAASSAASPIATPSTPSGEENHHARPNRPRGEMGTAAAAAQDGAQPMMEGGSMRFHGKVIPPRPRGSVGIVARWEAIQAARQRI